MLVDNKEKAKKNLWKKLPFLLLLHFLLPLALSLQRKKNGNFSGQSCHLRSFCYNDNVVMHDFELGMVKTKIFREVLKKARSCRQFL